MAWVRKKISAPGLNNGTKMRWKIFRLAALVGVAALALLLVTLKPLGHKLVARTYFANAMGLRAGAPVELAGVEIGSVASVHVRPELKAAPVEVVMLLSPPSHLRIPNDSIASLETSGVLGETYVEIDVASASGPPIGEGAVLKAKRTLELTAEQITEKLSEVLGRMDCDCGAQKGDLSSTAPQKKSSKNSSH